MGKICNNDLFFFFTNSKYLDYICYFAIFFCLVLLVMIQYKHFFNNRFKNLKRFLIVFSGSLFILFFLGSFFIILNKDKFEGCMNPYTKMHVDNKIIISGDSRMEFIEDDSEMVLPYNVIFVAKSGMTYDWFSKEAVPEIEKIIEEKDSGFKYSIVVNMGVNDLQENININERADDYFKEYEYLAEIDDEVNVYILSVNPIRKNLLAKTQPYNIRTNKKIERFNSRIQDDLNESGASNMFYCDAYNDLNFDTDDGLHYTRETNKKIIKYITDDCIKY